jgi:hypothetical protein
MNYQKKLELNPQLLEIVRQRKIENKLRSIHRHEINESQSFNTAIRRVKEIANLTVWSSCHADCYRFSLNETDKHARKKFELFYEYRRIGCLVFTELILNDNSRPDLIVCFPDGLIQIIEVIESETEESIKDKEERYPFQIVKVKA